MIEGETLITLRRIFLVLLGAAIFAACGATEPLSPPRIATLVYVSGNAQQAAIGASLGQPLVVRVQDQAGQPVAGSVVRWVIQTGAGVVTPSQTTTDADGFASTSLRLGTTMGPVQVTAALGETTPVLFTATATSAPAAKLVAISGDNQNAVVATVLPTELVLRVTDAVDNPKANVAVAFIVTSGGGTVNAPSVLTDPDGVARVRWTLGPLSGLQTMIASVPGVAPLTYQATARAGNAEALVVVSGNNQSGPPGAPLPNSLRVRATDHFGNPVAGVTVTWTPAAGSGSVNPAQSTTDAGGLAATQWTLSANGGQKTLVANGAGSNQAFTAGGTVTYQSISAGSRHSCAQGDGGVAYCWGFHGDGQLGIGPAPQGSGPVFSVPQPVGTGAGLLFSQVAAGRFHSCAFTLGGVASCWGINLDGRLGTGNTAAANAPAGVSGARTWKLLSPGQVHSCGLDAAGKAFCWGSNTEGQLGVVGGAVVTPDSAGFTVPVPVRGGLTFATVSAGGLHACGVDVSGGAWCWGNNTWGQLGDGGNTAALSPRAIGTGQSWTAISGGASHSCGIDAAGAGWCWGANASGQLGIGSTTNAAQPVSVMSGGQAYTAISAGQSHTCALTSSNRIYCWGANTKGQLGDGTTTNRTMPILVAGGLTWKAVSAGDTHTCGITTTNVAYCWGDNEFGQLGDGTTIGRVMPVRVAYQP